MARTFPTTVVQAMTAQHTTDLYHALLEITHSELTSIRIVNDLNDTISNGVTYNAFPFSVILPPDSEENQPVIRVVLDNVTREIIEEARTIAGSRERAKANLKIIEFTDPDAVLISYEDYEIINLNYNAQTVTFDMVIESFLTEPFPSKVFNPSDFPGVF